MTEAVCSVFFNVAGIDEEFEAIAFGWLARVDFICGLVFDLAGEVETAVVLGHIGRSEGSLSVD